MATNQVSASQNAPRLLPRATNLVSVQSLPQVHLLAEGKVVYCEGAGPHIQVTLDLGKGAEPTPTRGDVADIHSDLVCTHPLADQALPAKMGSGSG